MRWPTWLRTPISAWYQGDGGWKNEVGVPHPAAASPKAGIPAPRAFLTLTRSEGASNWTGRCDRLLA